MAQQVAEPRTIVVRASAPGLTAVGAGLALMVGSFLPWIKATAPLVGTITKSGMDGGIGGGIGDGMLTLAAGVVVLVLGFLLMGAARRVPVPVGWALVVVAVGVAALCAFEFADISNRFADIRSGDGGDLVALSYGVGLWLITMASVATAVAGFLAFGDR